MHVELIVRSTFASPRVLLRRKEIREGGVYEVLIEDVGRKGDGVAKLDKYIIYVPGTVKGAQTKVKIQKISGNVAFAVVSQEETSK